VGSWHHYHLHPHPHQISAAIQFARKCFLNL
jgi:hypothetical protein